MKEQNIRMICPALGPAVDEGLDALLSVYLPADTPQKKKPVLAVIYTGNGYTSELAENIAAGVEQAGDFLAVRVDLSAVNRDAALQQIRSADAYLFGP